ncbi:hypothetical protein JOE55_000751 [Kocuria palustris]|nr:hypothetical protein [Kocuria palustris]
MDRKRLAVRARGHPSGRAQNRIRPGALTGVRRGELSSAFTRALRDSRWAAPSRPAAGPSNRLDHGCFPLSPWLRASDVRTCMPRLRRRCGCSLRSGPRPHAPPGRLFTAWLASSVSGSSSLSPGGSVTEGTHSSALAPGSRRQLRLVPCQLRDGTARLVYCLEGRPSPQSRIGPARGNLIGLIRRGHGDAGDGRDPTRRRAARPRAYSARPLIGRVRNDHDICIEHR